MFPGRELSRADNYCVYSRIGGLLEVQIKLFATLRQGRFKTETQELPVGTQVKKVLEKLSLQQQEVAILLVNGQVVQNHHVLKAGDTVALFPPVSKG